MKKLGQKFLNAVLGHPWFHKLEEIDYQNRLDADRRLIMQRLRTGIGSHLNEEECLIAADRMMTLQAILVVINPDPHNFRHAIDGLVKKNDPPAVQDFINSVTEQVWEDVMKAPTRSKSSPLVTQHPR